MPHYKLYYFNLRARAELTRLIFAATETPLEDIRINNWQEEKEEIKPPFGQVPVLEVDGIRICQSMTIARFAAKITGLAGDTPMDVARGDMVAECAKEIMDETINIIFEKDPKKKVEKTEVFDNDKLPRKLGHLENMLKSNGGQWFVGKKLNWADLAVTDTIKFVENEKHPIRWVSLPKLEAHRKKIESIPSIAKHIAARPATPR